VMFKAVTSLMGSELIRLLFLFLSSSLPCAKHQGHDAADETQTPLGHCKCRAHGWICFELYLLAGFVVAEQRSALGSGGTLICGISRRRGGNSRHRAALRENITGNIFHPKRTAAEVFRVRPALHSSAVRK
jgi:hypothetical protein